MTWAASSGIQPMYLVCATFSPIHTYTHPTTTNNRNSASPRHPGDAVRERAREHGAAAAPRLPPHGASVAFYALAHTTPDGNEIEIELTHPLHFYSNRWRYTGTPGSAPPRRGCPGPSCPCATGSSCPASAPWRPARSGSSRTDRCVHTVVACVALRRGRFSTPSLTLTQSHAYHPKHNKTIESAGPLLQRGEAAHPRAAPGLHAHPPHRLLRCVHACMRMSLCIPVSSPSLIPHMDDRPLHHSQ